MSAAGAVDGATVLRVAGEVVCRRIAGETVLVPVRGSAADLRRMYTLSETAAFAWGRFDGARSVARVLEELLEEFDADPAAARADLDEFVALALEEGLLEVAG